MPKPEANEWVETMSLSLDIERHLPFPPETCFALWADPRELEKWWGPKDENGTPFRSKIQEWELREGAGWAIDMIAPDGAIYRQSGKVLEVERPRLIRLGFRWVESGEPGPQTEILVLFEKLDLGTKLRFSQTGFVDANARETHASGWDECLDRFEDAVTRCEVAAE